jgi:hypothetical protein
VRDKEGSPVSHAQPTRDAAGPSDAEGLSAWSAHSYLGRLEPTMREAILALGSSRTFRDGARLIREGANTDQMFILLDGMVKILVAHDYGDQLPARSTRP